MWKCNKCQNQNDDTFNFCWSCGIPRPKLNEAVLEPVKRPPTEKPAPSQKTEQQNSPEDIQPIRKPMSGLEDSKEPRPKPPAAPQLKERPPESADKPDRKPSPPIKEATETQKETSKPAAETAPLKKENPPKTKPGGPTQPELFSTFTPDSRVDEFEPDSVFDWQRLVFSCALRLAGFYLIFQVFLALPDLSALIYTAFTTRVAEGTGLLDLIGVPLMMLAAKLLFYLIGGIYFIAGGKILTNLVPRG